MSFPPAVKDRPEIPSELVKYGHLPMGPFRIQVPVLIYLGDDHQNSGLFVWFPVGGSTSSDGTIKDGFALWRVCE